MRSSLKPARKTVLAVAGAGACASCASPVGCAACTVGLQFEKRVEYKRGHVKNRQTVECRKAT